MNFPMSLVVVDVDAGTAVPERDSYVAAQQIQISRDFGPRWGVTATIRHGSAQAGEIQIRLLNRPTLEGAAGYHSTLPDGTPVAYVFVGLARQFGMRWESIASHEVLELLADPLLHKCIETPEGFIDCEVCDRVERESYDISGVPMSNFNFPECFEPPANLAGVRFDQMGTSTRPNEIRPGGYAQKFDPQQGWTQVGEMSAYRQTLADMGLSRNLRRRARYVQPTWIARLFGAKVRPAW